MSWKSILLTTVGILFSFAAVLCGDGIQSSRNLAQMLGFTFLSVALLTIALIFVAAAQIIDAKERESQSRKIKRNPAHNKSWRGDC